eukprot:498193-Rhodomonas_salina.1
MWLCCYASATRCPVLSGAMLLPGVYVFIAPPDPDELERRSMPQLNRPMPQINAFLVRLVLRERNFAFDSVHAPTTTFHVAVAVSRHAAVASLYAPLSSLYAPFTSLLRNRGTESEEQITRRLQNARAEMRAASEPGRSLSLL